MERCDDKDFTRSLLLLDKIAGMIDQGGKLLII